MDVPFVEKETIMKFLQSILNLRESLYIAINVCKALKVKNHFMMQKQEDLYNVIKIKYVAMK